MVVAVDVSDALLAGEPARAAVFVASCAERMAQLFTGLRGNDPGRAADVELYLKYLNDLWAVDLPGETFDGRAAVLEGFPELVPSEEGLTEDADIDAFSAVLCVRYAVLFRATGDPQQAVQCAHASLTSMGLADQNLPGSDLFSAEQEYQRRTISSSYDEESLSRLREEDRAIGLERLITIHGA
jgi:hypothetical protein